MTRRRDCLMTPHFLKWSFGPKIESADGNCQQTDSRNRFYLDIKTGPNDLIVLHPLGIFFLGFLGFLGF